MKYIHSFEDDLFLKIDDGQNLPKVIWMIIPIFSGKYQVSRKY